MTAVDIIPVLDYSKYQPNDPTSASSKEFLESLYQAMSEVGFFYIKNHGVPLELQQRSFETIKSFFKLPIEEKLKVELKNSPHFRGYSRLSKGPLLIVAHITAKMIIFYRCRNHRLQAGQP